MLENWLTLANSLWENMQLPLYVSNNSFRVGVLVRECEIVGGLGEEAESAQERKYQENAGGRKHP